MRVLVCGGRDYKDYDTVCDTLDALLNPNNDPLPADPHTIIHGQAHGADLLADTWAVNNYVMIEEYPADWATHGKAAGPIRNKQMLDIGKPDLVVAFPGGAGTKNMCTLARAAGVEVRKVGW